MITDFEHIAALSQEIKQTFRKKYLGDLKTVEVVLGHNNSLTDRPRAYKN